MGNRYSIVARLHTVALTLLQECLFRLCRHEPYSNGGCHSADWRLRCCCIIVDFIVGVTVVALTAAARRAAGLLYRWVSTSFRRSASIVGEHLARHYAVDGGSWYGMLP